MRKIGIAISTALIIGQFFLPSKVQAAWIKEGPIEVEDLGTLEVLVHQVDAVFVQVSLVDSGENVMQTIQAEERIARFTMVQPGSYHIVVRTNGYDPLKVYHSFEKFTFLNESF
jgi:hypothetical protein